jgi:hypothetical protein
MFGGADDHPLTRTLSPHAGRGEIAAASAEGERARLVSSKERRAQLAWSKMRRVRLLLPVEGEGPRGMGPGQSV